MVMRSVAPADMVAKIRVTAVGARPMGAKTSKQATCPGPTDANVGFLRPEASARNSYVPPGSDGMPEFKPIENR